MTKYTTTARTTSLFSHLTARHLTTTTTTGSRMLLSSFPSFILSTPTNHLPLSRLRYHQTVLFNSNNNNNNDSQEPSSVTELGLNELQTLLRGAVQRQDYIEAGRFSDELFIRLYRDDIPTMDENEKRLRRKKMSWRGLGAAPWLVDRLDSLNYTFPTTIQINTMEAVNQILNDTDKVVETTSLEERVGLTGKMDMGVVVSGSTGSGKTLAYLVPLLSTLSDSLFVRQRIRVGAEENVVGDTTDDLLSRISVVTSPVVRTNSRRPIRNNGPIATGASLATLGKSGTDVKSPLALIVVPTRELGIQTAMLLYELVGGSIKKDPTAIRGKANMFKYKGPKGIRIGCVLDDEEAQFGLKLQTDVAITTPQYIGKLITDGDLIPSKLRVVAYDEADLALEETPTADLTALFDEDTNERDYSRLTFMVGASVTESLGNLVVKSRILPEGKSYIATATRHGPIVGTDNLPVTTTPTTTDASNGGGGGGITIIDRDQPKVASLKDLDVCLDPGLKHQRVVVGNESGLLTLTRLLRKELEDYDARQQQQQQQEANSGVGGERPRVVVFFPDEAMAKDAIVPLRDALWGEHRLCVLLPKTGVNPLQMMEQFKNNQTTVMLATPNSVRGLDFPEVTHVYTLYLPMEDPREYVHLAGRVGRVGQSGSVRGSGGRVVSILKDEDADKMDVLARELGFEFTDLAPVKVDVPTISLPLNDDDDDGDDDNDDDDREVGADMANTDVEKMRRYLEDTMSFISLAGDEGDPSSSSVPTSSLGGAVDVESINEDYDEDEDEDEESTENEIGFQ